MQMSWPWAPRKPRPTPPTEPPTEEEDRLQNLLFERHVKFQEMLSDYKRQAGVSTQCVFILVHDDMNRALSNYQKWLNKSVVDDAVFHHLEQRMET